MDDRQRAVEVSIVTGGGGSNTCVLNHPFATILSIFTSTACARDSDGDCVSPCPASDGVRPGLDVLVPYILRGGVPKGRRATSSERHTPN